MAEILTPQQHIEHLEKSVALGDIAGMAQSIEALHKGWDALDVATQNDIRKLEAIFLSVVKMQAGGRT